MADITCWWMTCYLLLVTLVLLLSLLSRHFSGVTLQKLPASLDTRSANQHVPLYGSVFGSQENGINFVCRSSFDQCRRRFVVVHIEFRLCDGRECRQPFSANRLDLFLADGEFYAIEIKAGNVIANAKPHRLALCCNCSTCSGGGDGSNSRIYMVAGDRFTYKHRTFIYIST